jgi:uncharacterized protein (TIGR02145 family)
MKKLITTSTMKKYIIAIIFVASFMTQRIHAQETEIFTDTRDGQVYKTVKIGSQIWMAENLNYQTNSGSWVYDNKESNAVIYGRLYDWETAKIVCPSGWHLPTDDEWKQFEMYIGISPLEMEDLALEGLKDEGTKLRATSGWDNSGNGTDDYGFSGLPGGNRVTMGDSNIGIFGGWWSATQFNTINARNRGLLSFAYGQGYDEKEHGWSVRCLRD